MDRENDYNPCLSPYDIQNGGIYDPLCNGRVIDQVRVLQRLLRATISIRVVEVHVGITSWTKGYNTHECS